MSQVALHLSYDTAGHDELMQHHDGWAASCGQLARLNGSVTDGLHPEEIGGFWVVDVPSGDEALEWAAKTAAACCCAQEVRTFMPDPAVGN